MYSLLKVKVDSGNPVESIHSENIKLLLKSQQEKKYLNNLVLYHTWLSVQQLYLLPNYSTH